MKMPKYLRPHEVTWTATGGTNEYGEPIEVDPKTIYVRWEGQRKKVRNDRGEEMLSEATVLAVDDIKPGETLKDKQGKEWPVITVSEKQGLYGQVNHYEVMV